MVLVVVDVKVAAAAVVVVVIVVVVAAVKVLVVVVLSSSLSSLVKVVEVVFTLVNTTKFALLFNRQVHVTGLPKCNSKTQINYKVLMSLIEQKTHFIDLYYLCTVKLKMQMKYHFT